MSGRSAGQSLTCGFVWRCVRACSCVQDDMELTFKENQKFVVDALLSEDETYWWGTLNEKIGVFPSDTVQVLTGTVPLWVCVCPYACERVCVRQ